MNEKRVFEYQQGDRKFIVEIGELAKQANGACLVRFENTAVLSVAVFSDKVSNADFFPLTVLYQEKLYAAGKIPGGFLEEGRPSEHETLISRLIDRPLRPLFRKDFGMRFKSSILFLVQTQIIPQKWQQCSVHRSH